MEFKDKLNEYIELLDCTAKELAESSGLSAATISRYRSGERVPEANTQNFTNLVKGLVAIAEQKHFLDITIESISDTFLEFVQLETIDPAKFQANFNKLLTALSINISELAKFLNYDSSYISRIRNGQRQVAKPKEFIWGISDFIVRRYQTSSQKAIIASLINCNNDDLAADTTYRSLLTDWLVHGTETSNDGLNNFLEKLDKFDLNEYIRVIHFDKLKVPSAPFQLPTSRNYFGLKEMMDSELAFLKATVLSKSQSPVTMYSDMPMGEMAKDPDFPKKWMFGMALMLKKGLHLNQIHNIDRSFEDMMLGLESWIPMYMTGQVSPYYLKGVQNNVFSHLLKVSGAAALTGEAISGYHNEGKYYLTKNKDEVSYYKKQAEQLLSKASPLMEIYLKESEQVYHTFLQNDAQTKGNRRNILSSLPLYTATDELICKILTRNNITQTDQTKIMNYVNKQRKITNEILLHSHITDEIPEISEKEFQQFPMTLSLSNMFYEHDIFYTWQDYQEHKKQIQNFQKNISNYTFKEISVSAFRNIQISIHEGKWVIVSKNKAPAIHFLICHPKMRSAFENMIVPIVER